MRKKLYIEINETKVRENIETQHGHWGHRGSAEYMLLCIRGSFLNIVSYKFHENQKVQKRKCGMQKSRTCTHKTTTTKLKIKKRNIVKKKN